MDFSTLFVEGHVIQNIYFSEIDCLRDPIENEKRGANSAAKKKIQQTVNHTGSRRTLKSSSLFRDKIL